LCNDVFPDIEFEALREVPACKNNCDSPEESDDDDSVLDMTPDESDKPLPMRSVLTKPVLVTIANYANARAPQRCIGVMHSACVVDTSRVWWTQPESGNIGLWMSLYGGIDGIFQLFCLPALLQPFWPATCLRLQHLLVRRDIRHLPFRKLSHALAGGGPNVVVWLLIIVQLLSLCFFDWDTVSLFFPIYFRPADTDDMALSYNIHVHFIGRSEQTVARRGEWPWAGGDINSERCWTCCRGLVICVLPDA
jgi:hypothetical protein